MTHVTMALSHPILLWQESACDLPRDVKHSTGEPAMLWNGVASVEEYWVRLAWRILSFLGLYRVCPANVWSVSLGTPAQEQVWRKGIEGKGNWRERELKRPKKGQGKEVRAGKSSQDRWSNAKHRQRGSVQFSNCHPKSKQKLDPQVPGMWTHS